MLNVRHRMSALGRDRVDERERVCGRRSGLSAAATAARDGNVERQPALTCSPSGIVRVRPSEEREGERWKSGFGGFKWRRQTSCRADD